MTSRRPAGLLLALLFVACTGGNAARLAPPSARPPADPAPSPTLSETPPAEPGGTPSVPPPAAVSDARDCERAVPSPDPAGEAVPLPRAVEQVAEEVERIRGLSFVRPVDPEPVSQEEMSRRVRESVDETFPPDLMSGRGRAWITMGLIPPDTDLFQALVDYSGSQVIGYYDTISHELVFIGSENPSPLAREILAHELTHALDDQHFNLTRVDLLDARCRDEEVAAFLSLAEGSAQVHELRWVQETLTPVEQAELFAEAIQFEGPPASVPPFVSNLLVLPYGIGREFVGGLLEEGGQAALDRAFRRPPVSTEQVLHPERYPSDVPQAVDVADLAADLGDGWEEVDFLDVGEAWLRTMLELRLAGPDAGDAAAGWDGGRYRAWTDGSDTAVAMETVWDSGSEASEFGEALDRWAADAAVSIVTRGAAVRVLFASDADTLAVLERAAG